MADRGSENGDDQFNISTKIQLCGVLLKRPFGHSSNKWSKRFFVVKEGFLLYYSENEKKMFDKRGYFNIHPKGVIPLGGCTIEPVCDTGQQFAINIESDEFHSESVTLAADNHYERDKWVQILQEASRITWKNTKIGEAIIRELENQGLQLCRERQNYFDKLQEEIMALRDEIDKNEELEKVTAELDNEKKKLEILTQELREEKEGIRREYEETIKAMKHVQEDKIQMQNSTVELQTTLQELAEEKKRIVLALAQREEENSKLSQTHCQLANQLKAIEEDTKLLMEEKQEIEQRFETNELRAKVLEEEKNFISDHAQNLESSLQDLMTQKLLTEAELKEEILARIDAERHLQVARESLQHLESVIHLGGGNISDCVRNEILPDVKRLKKFFEDVAEEAKIDANKPIIMKNAILARKKYAQLARSQQIQTNRQEKAKSLGIVLEEEPTGRGLRRSLSTIVIDRSQRGAASAASSSLSLRRSISTRKSDLSQQPLGHRNTLAKTTTTTSTNVVTITIDGNAVQVRRKLSSVGEKHDCDD